MSCCTFPPFSPSSGALPSPTSSSSSSSYVTTLSNPLDSAAAPEETKNSKETAASLTVSEFTTLVSSALEYNPIIEPLAFPCRPESHCISIPYEQMRRPMNPGEKVTVLRKIKSILLREPPSLSEEQSSSQVPEMPQLPLPPPSDPLFTPHIPLPLALERGLINSAPESVSDTASEDRSDSEDRESESDFGYSHASQSEAPSSSSGSSDSSSSSSCSESSLSRASSSSLDLTSDPSDPFAKGCVQVVRQNTGSSSSCSLVCSLGTYSLENHPYAATLEASTSPRDSPPKKAKRKRALGKPPMPPPSLPLPLPPRSTVRVGQPSTGLPPLPPLLPMPTRPLPPTPCLTSPEIFAPRVPTKDWTLDLPLKPTAFNLYKQLDAGVTGVSGPAGETGTRRRKVSSLSQRARQNGLSRSAATSANQAPISVDAGARLNDVRPGHRRKGSPFPLLFDASTSPISTPLVTGAQGPSGSPQKVRAVRPPPLPHTLVLSPSGLPMSPRCFTTEELDIPRSPLSPTSPTSTCTSAETFSEPSTPLSGRAHIPGWFSDKSDPSDQGYEDRITEDFLKADVGERYWTASENVRMRHR
ncbi:hypothetical protein PQX77_003718 [Marasmius sp. AFHP31]|nr:hypothetical protein PQX77_003718 [Marasmius sp. AFHP31]